MSLVFCHFYCKKNVIFEDYFFFFLDLDFLIYKCTHLKKIIHIKDFKNIYLYRVHRGYLSHFLFEDFCVFRLWFLGRLWYAKISSELLASIE